MSLSFKIKKKNQEDITPQKRRIISENEELSLNYSEYKVTSSIQYNITEFKIRYTQIILDSISHKHKIHSKQILNTQICKQISPLLEIEFEETLETQDEDTDRNQTDVDMTKIVVKLQTSLTHGLSDDQILINKVRYGNNNLCQFFINQKINAFLNVLFDPYLYLFANLLLTVLSAKVSIIVMLVIYGLQLSVNLINFIRCTVMAQVYEQCLGTQVKVVRNGQERLITQDQLIVGDLVIPMGQKVMADGYLYELQAGQAKQSVFYSSASNETPKKLLLITVVGKGTKYVKWMRKLSKRQQIAFERRLVRLLTIFLVQIVVRNSQQILGFKVNLQWVEYGLILVIGKIKIGRNNDQIIQQDEEKMSGLIINNYQLIFLVQNMKISMYFVGITFKFFGQIQASQLLLLSWSFMSTNRQLLNVYE
ncbi:magnesium-translocating_P-type ATPase [Hexamita inflata]|uniref:Magnesium-translocating_P-type ATPase n=1 Tax=Hexamita inflata TaxID=28002 RepID=A0ABP1HR32_9EUKA